MVPLMYEIGHYFKSDVWPEFDQQRGSTVHTVRANFILFHSNRVVWARKGDTDDDKTRSGLKVQTYAQENAN